MERIVIAGAVGSTRQTLEALIKFNAPVVGVLQMRGEKSHTVTGFEPLEQVAAAAGIPCVSFANINDPEIVDQVREWNPDLMFVVGLSQLVRDDMLAIPKMGCVGFHPTFLPVGRGRAPLAWLTLDSGPGAASFFLIDDGVDSGPIFVQEPFEITPQDYAGDVAQKLETAIDVALERWVPNLLAGEWNPLPQDELLATYHGKRGPDDGLIDWHQSAIDIHALIRAAGDPHPGAYTWHQGNRLLVWRAELEEQLPWRGAIGRVLLLDSERGALIQTGEGLLWLGLVQADSAAPVNAQDLLRVGQKLGFVVQDEIANLRDRVAALEARLDSTDKA
jgi:methionyl-tRNA formyltransferase